MRAWAWIVAALAMVALGQEPPRAASPKPAETGAGHAVVYRITGTVVDARSAAPLAKTRVTIAPARGEPDAARSLVTSADGRFQFDRLPAGKYTLRAQRRGYAPRYLDEHEGFATAVVVGPGLESDGIVFRLTPEAMLGGRISDEANEPVRRARVMLFREDAAERSLRLLTQAGTDDEGIYRFPNLRPGTYVVAVAAEPWYAQRFEARGVARFIGSASLRPDPDSREERSPLDVAYPVTFFAAATEASAATPIVLAAGERVVADIALQPVPALHMRVRLPDSPAAAPNRPPSFGLVVRQRLFGLEMQIPVATAQLSPGEMEIAGLPPGHYEIELRRHDPERPAVLRQEFDAAADAPLEPAAAPAPQVAVAGKLVVRGAQQPWPRVYVQLRSLRGGNSAGALAQENGEFRFEPKLEPGRYELSVSGQQFMFLEKAAAAGARLAGQVLEVGGADVTLALAVALQAAAVEGVALRDGRPQGGAMIVLVPDDPANHVALFRRDQSDSDGTFTLPNVVPGRYRVLALANWDAPWQDPEFLRRYLPQAETLEVAGERKYTVRVAIR